MKISKNWQLVLCFVLFIFLDIGTKELARHFFESKMTYSSIYPYGGVGVFENFLGGIDLSFGFVQNSGAAFGMFSGFPKLILVLRTVILAILFYLLFMRKETNEKDGINRKTFLDTQWNLPIITLIFSGAIGNLIDNYRQGYVIDFINFHFYGYPFPLFNLADAFISIGAAIYIVKELLIVLRLKKFQAK